MVILDVLRSAPVLWRTRKSPPRCYDGDKETRRRKDAGGGSTLSVADSQEFARLQPAHAGYTTLILSLFSAAGALG